MNVKRLPFDASRGLPISTKNVWNKPDKPPAALKDSTVHRTSGTTTLSGRVSSRAKPFDGTDPQREAKGKQKAINKNEDTVATDFQKKDDMKLLALVKKFRGKGHNKGIAWKQIQESFGQRFTKYFLEKRYKELSKQPEEVIDADDSLSDDRCTLNSSSEESDCPPPPSQKSSQRVKKPNDTKKMKDMLEEMRREHARNLELVKREMQASIDKERAETARITKQLKAVQAAPQVKAAPRKTNSIPKKKGGGENSSKISDRKSGRRKDSSGSYNCRRRFRRCGE